MARSELETKLAGEYTIDELAAETGMTTRNIRAHQSRGLLPPPVVRGRTGYYSDEHIARLRMITQMQADGLNLRTIRRVLETVPAGGAGDLFDFARALRTAWDQEAPEILAASELADRFRVDPDVGLLGERARKLGVLSALPDGRIEARSPALLHAGESLVKLGIATPPLLAVQEELLRHAEGVAKAFVRLFLEQVWKPFDEAGQPESEWPRVREALDAMVPIAHEALAAGFRLAMSDEVEKAFGKALQHQARKNT
jgi:DNA-binding transcriptional MerR regulator